MHISLTEILFVAIGSFVLGCACGTWTIPKLPRLLAIYTMAKKLELRDKGYVGVFKNETQMCALCYTRARIGIDREDRTVMYCYKCGNPHFVGPDMPSHFPRKRGSTGKVVYFRDYNKK